MASAKKTALPAKKTAPAAKPAAKASAPAKAPAKAPAPKAAPARGATEGEAPPVLPKGGLQKVAGRDTLCQIEIVKDGHFFIARTQTDGGPDKEYKNTVFEDLLTEMVITLQEQLVDR